MIDNTPHFHGSPLVALVYCVVFLSTTLLIEFAKGASEIAAQLVPFFQLGGCCATILVGYITYKKWKAGK